MQGCLANTPVFQMAVAYLWACAGQRPARLRQWRLSRHNSGTQQLPSSFGGFGNGLLLQATLTFIKRSENCGSILSGLLSLNPSPFPQSSILFSTGDSLETFCSLLRSRARLRPLRAGLSLHLPRLQQLHILLLHRGSIAYASGLADMHRLLRCTATF